MKCEREIKITFTGDVMCEHTRLQSYIIDNQYSFASLFSPCREVFENSDYVVANLETPVAGKDLGYSYRDYQFNTPEQMVKDLRDAGVSMVTTANNHALDRGVVGLNQTIKNIMESGLEFIGTSEKDKRRPPLIKHFGDISVGFIAYTYGTEACYNFHYLKGREKEQVNLLQNQELSNPIQRYIVRNKSLPAKVARFAIKKFKKDYFLRNVEDYPQNDELQKKNIQKDIDFCRREKVDIIIACLHFGGQFNDEPTGFTKKTTEFFQNAGIDLVVGNHEHLIQSAQLDKQTPKVAYCLGNFTSNYAIDRPPFNKDAECSILLHVYLKKVGNVCKMRFAFTPVISVKEESGVIVTRTIYDQWNLCKSVSQKQHLVTLNNHALARFCGKELKQNYFPQLEYLWEDMI